MARTDIGRLPVSDDNPAGQDVKYEPDFEDLSEEINKLSSPTAVAGIDWTKVVSLGEKILRDQSKNLTVCCYLSVGLLHVEQRQLALGPAKLLLRSDRFFALDASVSPNV